MARPIEIIRAADFKPDTIIRSLDAETMRLAQEIVNDVRANGEVAVRKYAERFGERRFNQPLWIEKTELQAATDRISQTDRELLERVADRIATFARAQFDCLRPLTTTVPGGQAGHTIEPLERVGCYAPAGRFPLPSTVLMTAVTARVAGCSQVVVATPNPSDLMLAAASVAGSDRVLAVGGAQAIAALAYGVGEFSACDLICGPGSRWVTAAKKIVNGDCGIDMLAGPSELVILADQFADPETVAADLLAQAEHDVDARPVLIAMSAEYAEQVGNALLVQLADLSTAEIARQSLSKGAIVVANSMEEAVGLANQLAPEHLELHCRDASAVAAGIRNAGCVFIGDNSAEVFGDYGVGPNHTLPTAGTARWSAGLNVFTFLRVRTWLKLESGPQELVDDTARLAELEGLAGHRQAALRRGRG
jgi:phosphoribosyl-ATP pyrophosphohydrolase/phosphoribosyl-AMP cyclohydrolase/histidinol dehydrogenase